MKIDVRNVVMRNDRFEVTYKSDNITITEDICGYSQADELSEELVEALLDLSEGIPEYLSKVLNSVSSDEIINFLLKNIRLQPLLDEITYQTGEVITINNEEEI